MNDITLQHFTTIQHKMLQRGIKFDNGLSKTELSQIEDIIGAKVPPYLRLFLSVGLPISINGKADPFPQWRADPEAAFEQSRKWIDDSFHHDIKQNNYWHKLLGDRPDNDDEAVEQAIGVIKNFPPLIRIYGHRYICTSPASQDNPVLSIWEPTDTIYYGYNLEGYLIKEFKLDMTAPPPDHPTSVPYWGELFDL